MPQDHVVVGRIGPAHGLKGEVFVEPRTDEPGRRFAPGATVTTGSGTLTVATSRTHSGKLVVRFEEIDGRNAAEAARGTELSCAIDPDELPEDPEEFYDHQLAGLRVETTDGSLGFCRMYDNEVWHFEFAETFRFGCPPRRAAPVG